MQPGKRTDPDYAKMTIYIRAKTRENAKVKLLREGGDFSGIVERLVSAWERGLIDIDRVEARESPTTKGA